MRAIRPQALSTCRPCLLRLFSPQFESRTFASTPTCQKNGSLPDFTPTSSPELDNLLATFRTNIFIPAHLPNVQRKLIYRHKNHKLLTTEEPATVAIGDEVVQMVPLSRQQDEPATRSSLARILDLMKTEKDWRNLPEFLIGIKTAKRKLKPWQAEKIARKACMAGRWRTIMECCERVEGTGIGLWEGGVVREMLWAAIGKAQSGGWTKGAVEKALKLADAVWVMMQDPRHEYTKDKSPFDPMGRTDVVGVMLQLHAARVLRSGDKQDTNGKVRRFADHLLTIWSDGNLHVEDKHWNAANFKLMFWAPVWHGMKMAQQILGETSSIGEELANKSKDVENSLQKARDLVLTNQAEGGDPRRGLKMYEELSCVSS